MCCLHHAKFQAYLAGYNKERCVCVFHILRIFESIIVEAFASWQLLKSYVLHYVGAWNDFCVCFNNTIL